MRSGSPRRNELLLLALAVLLGGASLGLAAADALPTIVRVVVILSLLALAAMDLVLFSTVRLPQWLVGTTIVGLALANSRLPVASIMNYGRFVPPLILFVAVVRSGAWRDRSGQSKNVTWAAGIALALVYLSAMTSMDAEGTLERGVALTGVVAGVVAALRWSTGHRRELREAVLIAFSLLVFTNAALLVVGGDVYSGSRFRGWTINPNNLGILCAFAAPLAASEIMTRVGRRRLLAAALLVTSGLLLLQSGSRSSSLGALLALAAVLRISQVARSLVFVGVTLALLVLAPLAFRSAAESDIFTAVERSGNGGRDQVWPIAIEEIRKRPVTGAGFSTTEARFQAEEFGRFTVFRGGYFHNSYLEAGVELGLVGGVLLVAVGLFALSHLVRPVSVDNAWAAGMAVGGAVIGIFETGLLTPGSTLMFPFWLAVGSLAVKARRRHSSQPAAPARQLASASA